MVELWGTAPQSRSVFKSEDIRASVVQAPPTRHLTGRGTSFDASGALKVRLAASFPVTVPLRVRSHTPEDYMLRAILYVFRLPRWGEFHEWIARRSAAPLPYCRTVASSQR